MPKARTGHRARKGRKPTKTRRGACRRCGCTDERACDFGCSWVDDSHTLCSSCDAVVIRVPTPMGSRQVRKLISELAPHLSRLIGRSITRIHVETWAG